MSSTSRSAIQLNKHSKSHSVIVGPDVSYSKSKAFSRDRAPSPLRKDSGQSNCGHRATVTVRVLPCLVVLILTTFFLILIALLMASLNYDTDDDGAGGEFGCFPEKKSRMWTGYSELGPFFQAKTPYLAARQGIQKNFETTFPEVGSCKPVYLWLLARHGIRYPSKKDIARYRTVLPHLQRRLLAGGQMPPWVAKALQHWKYVIHDSDDHMLSRAGEYEEEVIAETLYKYFPSLLNSKSQYNITVSSKIRTKQTADAFMKGLQKVQPSNSGKLKFIIKEDETFTNPHKNPKEKVSMLKAYGPTKQDLAESQAARTMLKQFNDRYFLGDDKRAFSFNDLYDAYIFCAYENALNTFSPWCNIFTIAELRLMEYILDVVDYHKKFVKQLDRVGPIMHQELYRKLVARVETKAASNELTLYFSHDGLLKILVTYIGIYPEYANTTRIDACPVYWSRKWRSSNVVPFSSFFLVVLYQCDDGNYKLLPLWNEIPVKIKGCQDKFCDFSDFEATYKFVKPAKLW